MSDTRLLIPAQDSSARNLMTVPWLSFLKPDSAP